MPRSTYTHPMAMCPGCLCTIPPGTLVFVAHEISHRAPVQHPGCCDACGAQDLLHIVMLPIPAKENNHVDTQ